MSQKPVELILIEVVPSGTNVDVYPATNVALDKLYSNGVTLHVEPVHEYKLNGPTLEFDVVMVIKIVCDILNFF